jgi:hypothetical protein
MEGISLRSSAGSHLGETRQLLVDAEASLNRMLPKQRDVLRQGSLKRARQNLENAKKSLQSDVKSSDLSLARALKVIEDCLPVDDVEERRRYLVEGIRRFKSAGWWTDAEELEMRLAKLDAAGPPGPPIEEEASSLQASRLTRAPAAPAVPGKSEHRFSALLKSGSVAEWLASFGGGWDEAEKTDLENLLSRGTRDFSAPGYRAFLIACFETTTDRDGLTSLVERADKPTKRFVETIYDLKEGRAVECFISDSPLGYVTKLVETLAGLKEDEGPKRGAWEFQLSTGRTVTIISSVKKDPETGRTESYVFKLEPAPSG